MYWTYVGQSLDIGQCLDKLLRTYMGKQHHLVILRALQLTKGAVRHLHFYFASLYTEWSSCYSKEERNVLAL